MIAWSVRCVGVSVALTSTVTVVAGWPRGADVEGDCRRARPGFINVTTTEPTPLFAVASRDDHRHWVRSRDWSNNRRSSSPRATVPKTYGLNVEVDNRCAVGHWKVPAKLKLLWS